MEVSSNDSLFYHFNIKEPDGEYFHIVFDSDRIADICQTICSCHCVNNCYLKKISI